MDPHSIYPFVKRVKVQGRWLGSEFKNVQYPSGRPEFSFPHPHQAAQNQLSLVLGGLVSYSGVCRQQACMWDPCTCANTRSQVVYIRIPRHSYRHKIKTNLQKKKRRGEKRLLQLVMRNAHTWKKEQVRTN
jgi:hypothetical protein